MIQSTPHMRILVSVAPLDFRRGIDGIAGHIRNELGLDPFSGALFLFTNKRRTAIKLLMYDSQGFWLAQKRMSKGRFRWWPGAGDNPLRLLESHELQTLIAGGNPMFSNPAPAWRRIRSES